MGTEPEDADSGEGLTIDELAAAVGTTVRTTRYYASLGLIPPPERRGRIAYYGPAHRARLELVRALQEHGFTLQAIERTLRSVPDGASVEELALQRAMLTSWTSEPPEVLTRRQLDKRAGRRLGDADLTMLQRLAAIEIDAAGYRVYPHLGIGLEVLDLGVPERGVALADEAIRRHMAALADELTAILHEQVLEPYTRDAASAEDALRMERTVSALRRLTLEAVVAGFQRAANAVITRSLGDR